MTGSLLQLMTIVTYGNLYLHSNYREKKFYPSNPTFQFINQVKFSISADSFQQVITREFTDPNEWFELLKLANCQQLYLFYSTHKNPELPDHVSVAFANGGGNWHIVANFKEYSTFWNEHWTLNNDRTDRNKVWNVTYNEVLNNQPSLQYQKNSLISEYSQLNEVLENIECLAIRNNHLNFAECFRDGINALQADDPTTYNFASELILDKGYTLKARQIIVAACHSWVFGGMGSWNDISIKEEDSHEDLILSRKLFSLLNLGIEKAINSFDPMLISN